MNIQEIIQKQKKFPRSEIKDRITVLRNLALSIKSHEEEIFRALYEDLGKSKFEACATETSIVLEDIAMLCRKLPAWAKRRKVGVSPLNMPAKGMICPEPYGTVLIFSAWNYPFQLMMSPFAGAVAAGNSVVLKPAEQAPATAEIIQKIISEVFPAEQATVCIGGTETSRALLKEHFDYIFYTGGTEGGKAVARAAAENLTPITLELGGKSPCIVDKDANLTLTARRIAWGKFLNAGQTCVAPDYLLVHESVRQKLIDLMRTQIRKFFGDDPIRSQDYPQIVNERHFDRLIRLAGGRHIDSSREKRFIAPSIIDDPRLDEPLMQEEIFGPLLPVLGISSIEEAIHFINSRPKPLALYYFSSAKKALNQILNQTSSGGVCVNETVTHLLNASMPFGGVGASGMGAYHGQWSFDTFTHYKPVMEKASWIDLPMRYPPGLDKRLKLLKFLSK